jgi:hypothetical protein
LVVDTRIGEEVCRADDIQRGDVIEDHEPDAPGHARRIHQPGDVHHDRALRHPAVHDVFTKSHPPPALIRPLQANLGGELH